MHNSLSSLLFTPYFSPLSRERKELLVKPHTFWKVIWLGQEDVNSIWMLINKLRTLILSRERKKEGEEEKVDASENQLEI